MWIIGVSGDGNKTNFFSCLLSGDFFFFSSSTHFHVIEPGAANGRRAAPLEQQPAVEVPCWRALWQRGRLSIDLFLRFPTLSVRLMSCDHLTSSVLPWQTSLSSLFYLIPLDVRTTRSTSADIFYDHVVLFAWTLWGPVCLQGPVDTWWWSEAVLCSSFISKTQIYKTMFCLGVFCLKTQTVIIMLLQFHFNSIYPESWGDRDLWPPNIQSSKSEENIYVQKFWGHINFT